jgi:hypothetical protein
MEAGIARCPVDDAAPKGWLCQSGHGPQLALHYGNWWHLASHVAPA